MLVKFDIVHKNGRLKAVPALYHFQLFQEIYMKTFGAIVCALLAPALYLLGMASFLDQIIESLGPQQFFSAELKIFVRILSTLSLIVLAVFLGIQSRRFEEEQPKELKQQEPKQEKASAAKVTTFTAHPRQ